MNKRYSAKPRQYGNIGFQWKVLPHQDILHSELKKHVSKIEVDIKQLPGLLDGEKDADWSTVTITYGYIQPGKTILEGYTEAEEVIYGPQDKVYNHIVAYYPEAARMFIDTWNTAKHKNLRSLTNIRSPFLRSSTAQKLNEEFYKSERDPKQFAEKLKKDKANIYNELKGKRKISVEQALEYSKEFGCDPVKLLFEDLTTECWGNVDLLKSHILEERYVPGRIRSARGVDEHFKNDIDVYNKWKETHEKNDWQKKSKTHLADLYDKKTGKPIEIKNSFPIVKVPRDIYSPDIKAVRINSKGSYLNNYIAYYYFAKNQSKSAHGKLAVVGQDWINDDFGIQEIYYWFGIYEELIGGGANILNPDPLAKNKYIAKNLENITFIAPVISLVHPSTLREDSARREALRWTDKIFEEQKSLDKLTHQIEEFKRAMDKMSEKQKEYEMSEIERLIKEEEVKKDQSFLQSLFRKKSA